MGGPATGRWAVYYAPPADHPLWHLGTSWLGRDPETGRPLVRPACGLDPGSVAALTGSPARYGFHATLKPPFALAAGRSPDDLSAAVAALAARHAPFDAPPVRPATIGGFRALVLSAACPAMDALAAGCVRELDGFRAPPPEEETARRRAAGLTRRQEELLQRWGYPYVMEEFRFHMTLTDSLTDVLAGPGTAAVDAVLDDLFGPLAGLPLPVRDIALFHQGDRSGPFRLVARFPLNGTATDARG